MPTGKSKSSRPRAGHGFGSAMTGDAMRTRVSSAKPARHRNRVKPAKPAAVSRRSPRKT
jgi:hypothetical protein